MGISAINNIVPVLSILKVLNASQIDFDYNLKKINNC